MGNKCIKVKDKSFVFSDETKAALFYYNLDDVDQQTLLNGSDEAKLKVFEEQQSQLRKKLLNQGKVLGYSINAFNDYVRYEKENKGYPITFFEEFEKYLVAQYKKQLYKLGHFPLVSVTYQTKTGNEVTKQVNPVALFAANQDTRNFTDRLIKQDGEYAGTYVFTKADENDADLFSTSSFGTINPSEFYENFATIQTTGQTRIHKSMFIHGSEVYAIEKAKDDKITAFPIGSYKNGKLTFAKPSQDTLRDQFNPEDVAPKIKQEKIKENLADIIEPDKTTITPKLSFSNLESLGVIKTECR